MGHNKCVLTGYTGPFSGFVFTDNPCSVCFMFSRSSLNTHNLNMFAHIYTYIYTKIEHKFVRFPYGVKVFILLTSEGLINLHVQGQLHVPLASGFIYRSVSSFDLRLKWG